MSDYSDSPRTEDKKTSFLQGVVGISQFDDRVDVQPNITTAETITVLSRSLRIILQAKVLFFLKFILQFGMVIPGLIIPWLARIVVDNVIRGQPFGETEVQHPPFMNPIVDMLVGRDPLDIMIILSIIFFVMLVLVGSRIGGLSAGLLQGQDAATQAENQISAGGSQGGGIWGLLELMVSIRLTQKLANYLRTRLFERLTRLPITTLDNQRTGDSIYRVLYDVPMTPDLIYQLSTVPFFFALGALLNLYILEYSYGQVAPQLIWVAWLTFPIAFLITFPFSGALRRTNQNKRAAGAATTNVMEESVSNVTAVQSLGATKKESKRFADRSAHAFLRERYVIAVVGGVGLIFAAVAGLAGIYVTVLITDKIIDGTMSAGDFATLFGIYVNISLPAAYFGAWWIKLQDVIAAVRRVFFFMDYESEEERLDGIELQDIHESISFENVSFVYPDGNQALSNVDQEFRIGEFVAIVGPTGSGKTTLAYLVPSLLLPTSGRVLVDGLDIQEINVTTVRDKVSYVFQEHLFLATSIRKNLLLANPNASDQEINAALEVANCTEFIRELPDGIDTRLGRGGDTLSVGQQQRLSIARGLLRKTRILILDEPTAALDSHTELQLVESLQQASEDRLVIVIAHRLSTIRHADRILFLEDGKIVEEGSHDALIQRDESKYKQYVELASIE